MQHPASLFHARRTALAFGLWLWLSISQACGQTLTSGANHDGTIAANQSNRWTLDAEVGDRLILRDGRLTGAGFNPWMRLFAPDGTLIGDTGGVNNDIAHEIAVTTTQGGTFSVVMADSAFGGANDTGTYRLFYARMPGTFVVGDDGGELINGANHDASITVGDLDLWTFHAAVGDRVLIRSGRTSGSSLNPWIRIYDPAGQLALDSGANNTQVAQELSLLATVAGAYTVMVTDSNNGNPDDTGTYRLHYFHFPGEPMVADDAGTLVNGANNLAAITTGDLDAWAFNARAGDTILLRASRIAGDANFNPWIRAFGADGGLVADGGGGTAQPVQELSFVATRTGAHRVLVGDGSSGNLDDTGTYQLCFVRIPGAHAIADDGGLLTNGVSASGLMEFGDLDVWQFIACRGETVDLRLDRVTNTNSFDPQVRLYAPNGALLASKAGGDTVAISLATTHSGRYTVVVSDGSSGGLDGVGEFRLVATGILGDGFQLCRPLLADETLDLAGLGGVPGATVVVQTSTDAGLPGSAWTPIHTNRLDDFGAFHKLDLPRKAEPQRFYRALQE